MSCEAVVVAGGAWSRLILSAFDAHLPQLKVRSSVFRTAPIDTGVEQAIAFSDFALRKRLDGGYTVASLGGSIADIVPDSFRFFRDFVPSLSTEWRSLRFRFGERFSKKPSSGSFALPIRFQSSRKYVLSTPIRIVRPMRRFLKAQTGYPFVCIGDNSTGMGRSYRYHARCHSGYFACAGHRRIDRGHRLFRTRFRNRTGRREARRRYGQW